MKTIEMMNAEQFAGLAIAADALRLLSDILSDHAAHPEALRRPGAALTLPRLPSLQSRPACTRSPTAARVPY